MKTPVLLKSRDLQQKDFKANRPFLKKTEQSKAFKIFFI